MRYIFITYFLILNIFFSCSKNKDKLIFPFQKHYTDLPNFGNVDIDNVFRGQSIDLKNKDKIMGILDEYSKNWDLAGLSGGFIIAHGDKILLEKYTGFGRENNTMPINSETSLHLASVSKPITAMAILKLIEAGKINLDQKVTSIFPNFPYKEVTIFHLLTHRSGLQKYEYYLEYTNKQPKNKYFTNQEIFDIFVKDNPKLVKDTGSGFMYNNLNYAILALIIEKITNKPYPQAMQEMVFLPLGMKNTFVFEEKHIDTAAQSFYRRDNKPYPMDQYDLIYGDKNIYSTPRDLLNLSKAMFSDDFLPQELMEKVFVPYNNEKKGINNYALGFRLKVFENNKVLPYHTGWWHGSNTIFIHLPNSKATIIALGNKYSKKIYGTLLLSNIFENFYQEELKSIIPDEESIINDKEIYNIQKNYSKKEYKNNISDSLKIKTDDLENEEQNLEDSDINFIEKNYAE